jgi:hypothetical protein
LSNSAKDFLGLFPSYHDLDVRKAISHLKKSIALNKSGKFENILLNSHYYMGKAYLLLDDIESAKKHLNIVVNDSGEFFNGASKLLNELN